MYILMILIFIIGFIISQIDITQQSYAQSSISQQLPLYLAIEARNQESALDIVKQTIHQTTEQIKKKFKNLTPEELQDIEDIDHLDHNWKKPATFHITTLFVGRNEKMKESKFYKSFVAHKDFNIEFQSLIYVYDKIACSPTFPKGIEIQNKFPHMTLMTDNWTPVLCNDVVEAVYGENGPLAQVYSKLEENDTEFLNEYKLKIKDEEVKVFVHKWKNHNVIIPGVTEYM